MPHPIPKKRTKQVKPTPANRSRKVDGTSTFGVVFKDGRQVTCDPKWPLKRGREVVVLYPAARKGEPRKASDIGTLQSASAKTRIAWVVFPMEDGGERVSRIDMSKGHVVARVTGVLTPVPWADDPKPARRAQS